MDRSRSIVLFGAITVVLASATSQSSIDNAWRFGPWLAVAVLLSLSGLAAYLCRAATSRLAVIALPQAVLGPVRPEMMMPAAASHADSGRSGNLLPSSEALVAAAEPEEPSPEQMLEFYRDVAKLLRVELGHDPKRTDLRHKLLEVYYADGAKTEFLEQTRCYLEQLRGRADEYWPDIVRMGRDLLPYSDLYTDTPPVMERAAAQTPVTPVRPPAFQRFYEAVNQAKLGARQAELEKAWGSLSRDPSFQRTFGELLNRCVDRPTPLLQAERLSAEFGGARVYRKYEDRRADGDIAAVSALGQVLLAHRMGKKRVSTATIDGEHGAAVANAARLLGLECLIYMKEKDQNKNPERVRRMHDLGASVITVQPSLMAGGDDVRIHALNDWMLDGDTTLYIDGVDAGPYPYPGLVLYFQMLVGREARAQMLSLAGGLPDAVIASTADGFSAIGLLQSFFADRSIGLYCIERAAAGESKADGHGFRREHSSMRASGRVSYVDIDPADAERAIGVAKKFQNWTVDLAAGEVLAQARRLAGQLGADQTVLLVLPKPR